MKLEVKLGLILSALIVVFAIALLLPIASGGTANSKRWRPLFLVASSLFLELLLVNLVTFGPLTLDYSLRFAAAGIPANIVALLLTRKLDRKAAPRRLLVSAGFSLLMWLFLITLH